jgi:hypothetical protein
MMRGEAVRARDGREPACPRRATGRVPLATGRASIRDGRAEHAESAERGTGRPAPVHVPEFTSWADVWGLTRRSC